MNVDLIPSSNSAKGRDSRERRWGAWFLIALMAGVFSWGMGWGLRYWSISQMLRQARSLAMTDLKQAQLAYRRYLQQNPVDSTVKLELAELLKHREPDAAFAELRTIRSSDERFIDAARQTAALAIELGRDYDAVSPLLFLEQTFSQDGNIQLELAELRFRERDFESALKHARRSRELNPQLTAAWLVEAESLDELKRPSEMVLPLEAALQLDPDLPQVRLNLAYVYPLVAREDEAFEHVNWFLKRFPQSAAGYRTLAMVQRARGNHDEALSAVQQSLRLKPKQLEATLLEAELLLFLRRPDEAYQVLERMSEMHGPEFRMLTLLQRAAQFSGRKAEADNWRARLSRLSPNGRSP